MNLHHRVHWRVPTGRAASEEKFMWRTQIMGGVDSSAPEGYVLTLLSEMNVEGFDDMCNGCIDIRGFHS